MRESSLPGIAIVVGAVVMIGAVVALFVAIENMTSSNAEGFDYTARDYMIVVSQVGLTPLALGAIAAVLGKMAEREQSE